MNDDNPELGKALLVIGGVILGGVVISKLLDDEPAREAHQNVSSTTARLKQRKKTSEQLNQLKDYVEKEIISPKYIVAVDPKQRRTSRSLDQKSTSNYPPIYYTLSKSQQYKYRQKLAKDKRLSEL